MASPNPIVIISCGVFKAEIEALCRRGEITTPVVFLKSRLHMYPEKLQQNLNNLISEERAKGNKIVLLYGDCQPDMHEMEKAPDISRVSGLNCPNILLDTKLFKKLQRQGAFFLLPEWTLQWQEIFHSELGLSLETAQSFMPEMVSKLIYLDTGVIPPPIDILDEIAKFSNLPWEILPAPLTGLVHVINAALAELTNE